VKFSFSPLPNLLGHLLCVGEGSGVSGIGLLFDGSIVQQHRPVRIPLDLNQLQPEPILPTDQDWQRKPAAY